MFKAGDRVFHRWSHPQLRPSGVKDSTVRMLQLSGIGTVLGDVELPDVPVTKRYWYVLLGDDIVEWSGDLMGLVS